MPKEYLTYGLVEYSYSVFIDDHRCLVDATIFKWRRKYDVGDKDAVLSQVGRQFIMSIMVCVIRMALAEFSSHLYSK